MWIGEVLNKFSLVRLTVKLLIQREGHNSVVFFYIDLINREQNQKKI